MLVLQSSLSLLVSVKVSPMWEEKFSQSDLQSGPVNPNDLSTLSIGMATRYLNSIRSTSVAIIEARDISNWNEE